MKEIPLTQGKVALVDDEDFERVMAAAPSWRAMRDKDAWYAVANGRKEIIRMHRIVITATQGEMVDHRNGDGLDNRRDNLRFATLVQNAQNRRKRLHTRGVQTASPYKGVVRIKGKGRDKWAASIKLPPFYRPFKGHQFHLGTYRDGVQAGRTYDVAAQYLYGPFARLNLPIAELPGC